MAEYSNLSATINAQIRANGVQAITGPVLNAVLAAMVNVLGDGYRLNGVAVPADNPGSPDNRVAYLAAQDGTYTNFGGLTISGEVALLLWDSVWTKATLFSIDTAVTPGSGNLVTSGAVADALTTLAGNIAAAYMQLVPGATEDNLASFDGAGQVKDSGIAAADVVKKDGVYPDLFAGYAGNLVDTRSAGTPQGPYAFRQSGGDGVDYMRKIKGKTEVFNQLVGDNDTEVTVPSGHQYFAIIGGTASVATSDGSPISVTGGVDIVVDLTLEGLGLTTADQFQALHPLPYYNYNAGVLKNNAATGIKTTGFNQWDEEWEVGDINNSTGQNEPSSSTFRAKNYIPVFPNTAYYVKRPNYSNDSRVRIFEYDANKNYLGLNYNTNNEIITLSANTRYIRFRLVNSGTTYNHDICINLSDASRNGEYEPYWERTLALGLNSIPCHDENNNAVVVNGLDGVGSSYDEAVVENGLVTKIIKRRARANLGDLVWTLAPAEYRVWSTSLVDGKVFSGNDVASLICPKYTPAAVLSLITGTQYQGTIGKSTSLSINDSALYNLSTPEQVAAALNGIYLDYPLATPKVLTLDTPFPALIEVDNLGTQERLPADTADNPQGGFESDSNYSVSTANLVRLLGL